MNTFRGLSAVLLLLLLSINLWAQFPALMAPRIWLSADAPGDSGYWQDISGHGLNAYESGGTLTADSGWLNYQPCLIFDSVHHPLQIAYYPSPVTAISIFSVYKTTASNNALGLWSIRLDSANFIEMSTNYIKDIDSTWHYADSTPSMPALNMLLYSWSDKDIDSTLANLKVVGSEQLGFSGKFAEFMLFDTAMTYEELTKVHTYLAIKYGIGMEGMDYMNSQNEVLWSYEENIDYRHNIAGLGKDSMIKINQKQSAATGGDAILTISAGSLSNCNRNNPNELQELDYMIWGDNGDTLLRFNVDTLENTSIDGISAQKWLMNCSGISINLTGTYLRLFAPNIADSLTINLLINRESDFAFPDSTTTIIAADSIDTLGYYYFKNVFWDIDLSGSDAFTFQFEPVLDINDRSQISSNNTQNNGRVNSVMALQGEEVAVLSFDVYPNPSQGEYIIDILLKEKGSVRISIQDENGRITCLKEFNGADRYTSEGFIEGKGCYLFILETETESRNVKFIVQ